MFQPRILRAFIVLLAFTTQIGCVENNINSLNVEIKVPVGDYDSIAIYMTQESITAYPMLEFERGYFDSLGSIQLDLESNEMAWFFVTLHPNRYDRNIKHKSRVFMLVRPGESYKIEYDSSHPLLFKINGNYEKAQNLFNRLSHNQHSDGYDWSANSDTQPASFLMHLEDSIANSIKPFKELYKKNEIDKDYYNSVGNYIKYSHASGLITHFPIRQRVYETPALHKYNPEIHPLQISDKNLSYIEEVVFEKYPITKKETALLPNLGDYINQYLIYRTRNSSNINHSSYEGRFELVNIASEYLDEDLVELYFAHHFNSASLKSGPDSLATYLFVEFKKRYPDSHFMPGIIENVTGLTGYYAAFYPGLYDSQRANVEFAVNNDILFSPDYKFIEGKESITVFDSLLNQFKGKNIYVDFWASWCPPCRYEFRFVDSLHHFLQANNIEMLYISTDEDESKWKNALSQYDLKGHHYRVSNPELRKELRTIVNFLPTFMIVDSTGNIVEYDAERPHSKSKLYEQLTNSLK